eukprot:SAG11_NODE_23392_length_389_cov_1.075862_1_plen_129_part_11
MTAVCVESESACAADPCQHGAYCISLPNDSSEYACCKDPSADPLDAGECVCPVGYANTLEQHDCQEVIDNCGSDPCLHDGSTCQNEPGAYACTCADGFHGTNCAEEYDECASNPCGISWDSDQQQQIHN